MKLSFASCSVALVTGFLVVWFVKPMMVPAVDVKSEEYGVAKESLRSSSRGGTREVKMKINMAYYGDLAKKLDDPSVKEDIEQLLGSLDQDALISFLTYYQSKAGFSGLSDLDRFNYQKVLSYLHDKDEEAALGYCSKLESEKDRISLLSDLIRKTADEGNFEQIHEQIHKYMRMDDGSIRVSRSFLELAVKSSPEDLIQFSKYSTAISSSIYPVNLEYPEGFPFQQVVAELRSYKANLPKGEVMAYPPGNLIGEWAKKDSQSAYDWVVGNAPGEHKMLADFIEGYATTASSNDLAVLMADHSSKLNGDYFMAAIAMSKKPDLETYSSFINNLDEGSEQLNAHNRVLERAIRMSSEGAVGVVLAAVPMDQHLELFSSDTGLTALSQGYDRDKFISALVRVGHAREDVENVFPGKK